MPTLTAPTDPYALVDLDRVAQDKADRLSEAVARAETGVTASAAAHRAGSDVTVVDAAALLPVLEAAGYVHTRRVGPRARRWFPGRAAEPRLDG